jgi:hypothetical protein
MFTGHRKSTFILGSVTMDSLFNQATNLTELNQGTRGERILGYMTTPFSDGCAMSTRNLQGNRLRSDMTSVIDVESILRANPQLDYVNNSRSDFVMPNVPLQGLNVPDCQNEIQTDYVKSRTTNREMDAPALVLRGGNYQTGVMQIGEDTRTTFKYSQQQKPEKEEEKEEIVVKTQGPNGDTLLQALQRREKSSVCQLYPKSC